MYNVHAHETANICVLLVAIYTSLIAFTLFGLVIGKGLFQ